MRWVDFDHFSRGCIYPTTAKNSTAGEFEDERTLRINDRHVFLLMAQYHGKAAISVDEICRDYFPHLDPPKFIRKVGAGDIAIPMIRMEASQKTAKRVHINDLAEYIDRQAKAARKECLQLAS